MAGWGFCREQHQAHAKPPAGICSGASSVYTAMARLNKYATDVFILNRTHYPESLENRPLCCQSTHHPPPPPRCTHTVGNHQTLFIGGAGTPGAGAALRKDYLSGRPAQAHAATSSCLCLSQPGPQLCSGHREGEDGDRAEWTQLSMSKGPQGTWIRSFTGTSIPTEIPEAAV